MKLNLCVKFIIKLLMTECLKGSQCQSLRYGVHTKHKQTPCY